MKRTLIAALVATLILAPVEAFAAKPSGERGQQTVDLGVTLTGPPSAVKEGETVNFTSVLANTGPLTATNIRFEFMWWSSQMELVSHTIDIGSCQEPNWGGLICSLSSVSKGQKATLSVNLKVVESVHSPIRTEANAYAYETDSNLDNNRAFLETVLLLDPNAPLARCGGVANGTSRVFCEDWFVSSVGDRIDMRLTPASDFTGVLEAQLIYDDCDWTDSCQEVRGAFVNGILVHGTGSLVVSLGYDDSNWYRLKVIAAPTATFGAGVAPICRGIFMGTGMGFEVCTPPVGTGSRTTGTAAFGSFQGTINKA